MTPTPHPPMTIEYTCIKDKHFWETEYSIWNKRDLFYEPPHQHTCTCRAVAKIWSCWVYVISKRGIVQLGNSFGSTYCILLLFPRREVGAHAHSCRGKSLVPVSLWQSWQQYMHMYTVHCTFTWVYSATGKTVKTWNMSRMFIVLWPITAKIRTRKLATKPQTN